MRIAVLGTGTVGRTLAARFDEMGHEVVMGTRDVSATLVRDEGDAASRPALSAWLTEHPGVSLVTMADAAAGAEVIVNATSGQGSVAALEAAGRDNVAGKVVIDVANPLDFSAGFPPSFFVKDTDSLGERLQAAFPSARIVKALNTVTADVMVDPGLVGGGDHTMFVSGDDPDAKSLVIELLHNLGHRDVIDLGDITTARGTEMYVALWVRAMSALGSPMFNIKVVR
jgi:predicted dinucleotide-binding enzyme